MNGHSMGNSSLIYKGASIGADGEMLNLTDMWRASGADESKRPSDWRKLPSTKEFVSHVAFIGGKSPDEIFEVSRGGRPRTMAHWQVAIAYAKYLSPEFHVWCNTVVRRHMEAVHAEGVFDDGAGPTAKPMSHWSAKDFNRVTNFITALTKSKAYTPAEMKWLLTNHMGVPLPPPRGMGSQPDLFVVDGGKGGAL